MKTHILLAICSVLFVTACASNQGRSVSSTAETPEEELEHTKWDGQSGRDYSQQ